MVETLPIAFVEIPGGQPPLLLTTELGDLPKGVIWLKRVDIHATESGTDILSYQLLVGHRSKRLLKEMTAYATCLCSTLFLRSRLSETETFLDD